MESFTLYILFSLMYLLVVIRLLLRSQRLLIFAAHRSHLLVLESFFLCNLFFHYLLCSLIDLIYIQFCLLNYFYLNICIFSFVNAPISFLMYQFLGTMIIDFFLQFIFRYLLVFVYRLNL